MFMLICKKSCVTASRVTLPPIGGSNKGGRRRSRKQWMHAMNVKAFFHRVEHYAFRYDGQWHLCSIDRHDTPLRSIPGDARAAAEMWLIHQEHAHG